MTDDSILTQLRERLERLRFDRDETERDIANVLRAIQNRQRKIYQRECPGVQWAKLRGNIDG